MIVFATTVEDLKTGQIFERDYTFSKMTLDPHTRYYTYTLTNNMDDGIIMGDIGKEYLAKYPNALELEFRSVLLADLRHAGLKLVKTQFYQRSVSTL